MSLQQFIAKMLFAMPDGLKIAMAGGKPLTIQGRQLDPNLQLVAWNGRKAPPLSSLPAEVVQQAVKANLAQFAAPLEAGVAVEAINIPSPEGHQIPARLYKPQGQEARIPLMVYYHMGGGVIGDLDTCHAWCSILAFHTKGPVLSVDYRLAPPHQFPAGLNDVFTAYEYGVSNAARFGAHPGKAAVGGDSMGGNFSAIVAQKYRDTAPPALQLLIYPAVDLITDYSSRKAFGNTFSLSTDTMNWFMEQYLPPGTDKSQPFLSPALTPDLAGLAPAIVITAGHDPLVDEGDDYAKKLATAGVTVTHKRYDNLAHAFTAFTALSPASRAACLEIAGMTRSALERA